MREESGFSVSPWLLASHRERSITCGGHSHHFLFTAIKITSVNSSAAVPLELRLTQSVIVTEPDDHVEKMKETVRYVNVRCPVLLPSGGLGVCSVPVIAVHPVWSNTSFLCTSVTRSCWMFLKRPSLVFRYRQCHSLLQLRYSYCCWYWWFFNSWHCSWAEPRSVD